VKIKTTNAPRLMAGIAAALSLTACAAQAQEQIAATGIAAPKNRAPVAKDLLRVKLPRPQKFSLTPGGAHILVVEDHTLPLLTISISVRAGSLFEDNSHRGVASATASLLSEGTTTRNYDEINLETARLGASVGSSADAERATVSVSGLAQDEDKLIDLLADVLLHPSFPADRLEKVKFYAVASRPGQKTNAGFLADQLTREVLYGVDTPYGRPAPSPEQVSAITQADLRAFYDRYYVNSPTTLIGVVGDVRGKDVTAKLQKALAGWKAGSDGPSGSEDALPAGSFAPKDKTAVYLVDRPGSAQTYLSFSNIAIKRTDPDIFPLVVANYILGGSFNSRLNEDLREQRGYTYGVSSGVSAGKYPGMWSMGGAVRNAVTAPAAAEFVAQFDRMQQGLVTDAEMDAAKRAIIGSFALTLESPGSILGRLTDVENYGLPADYWDTYPQKLQAVTPADVQRVTRKYLGTGRIQLFAVGQRQDIEEGLKPIGPVTIYSPDQVLSPEAAKASDAATPAAQ
jgi:zinc protease